MKGYLKDKRLSYGAGVILIAVLSVSLSLGYLMSKQKELKQLKSQQQEMMLLKDEFVSLKSGIELMERKKKISKLEGVIPAIDEVFSSLGLKNRIKAIKPASAKKLPVGTEEQAEVSIEKISMNEMLNLFYRIENSHLPLILKKADIKTSFEKAELFNLSVTVSLIYEK